jgi:hypothetical protein
MNSRDRDEELSAYRDDALSAVEREAVRLRIERDPEARRALAALGAASDAYRGAFAHAAKQPIGGPPPTLSADGFAAVEAAERRAKAWRVAAAAVAVIALACGAFFVFRGEGEAPTAALAHAAKEVSAPEAYVEITASAPLASIFGGKAPGVRGVLGPGGRFYGELDLPAGRGGAGAVPWLSPFVARGGEGGSAEADGRGGRRVLHAGFDGEQLWRYAEGDAHVDVAPVEPSQLAEVQSQLRAAFGADLLFGAEGPALGFGKWLEVVSDAAAGKFEVAPAGERPFENGRLTLYVVRSRAGAAGKGVGQATVGVDEAGDLRLIEVNIFRILLRKMKTPPDPARFSFRAYSPPDAELRRLDTRPPATSRPRRNG